MDNNDNLNMGEKEFDKNISAMREFQKKRKFLDIDSRMEVLKNLYNEIDKREGDIADALRLDLGKSEEEAFLTEILMVKTELRYLIRKARKFASPKRVKSSIFNFPSKNYILNEPYGIVLVVSPWNYPFNLSIIPFAGAIASGNSVVLKPSSQSKHTTAIIDEIIKESVPIEYGFVLSGSEANSISMEAKFDFIFFTGGEDTGRKFYEKAAKDMCPVVLELGGKSPALILDDADIELSVKRLLFGKLLNSGQTCVSVDYVYCSENVLESFLSETNKLLGERYSHWIKSDRFGKIINEEEYLRLKKVISEEHEYQKKGKLSVDKLGNIRANKVAKEESIYFDDIKRKISPVVFVTDEDSPLMKRENFGPVLPVIVFSDVDEVIDKINSKKTPLAFYVFSKDEKKAMDIMKRVSFGGGAINDTIQHIVGEVPFGGFRDSGIGKYHGRDTYFTFVHEKSVMSKSLAFDMKVRYPGEDISLIKKIFG